MSLEKGPEFGGSLPGNETTAPAGEQSAERFPTAEEVAAQIAKLKADRKRLKGMFTEENHSKWNLISGQIEVIDSELSDLEAKQKAGLVITKWDRDLRAAKKRNPPRIK
jgi:hypothetical protein